MSDGPPVSWWELGSRDVDALCRFYASAFGWEFAMEEGGLAELRTRGQRGIPGGIRSSVQGRPAVSIAIESDDLDHSLGRITDAGGSADDQTPADLRIAVFFRDPEGHRLGLRRSAPPS